MITSIQNPKIQWVRKLQSRSAARREAGAFVVEGVRLAEEALQAGWQAQWVLFTAGLSPRGMELVAAFDHQGVRVEMVSAAVMEAASDTQTPQGLLVVLDARSLALPSQPDFLLVVDGVRDPGNLGTILRTAVAAGVQGLILPPGVVDVFSPKVLRSAMGAHFRLPLLHQDWAELPALLKAPAAPLQVCLADAAAGVSYTQADFRSPLALVIGGEAAGAGLETARLVDQRVHIPMPGQSESLNAAVAAAILLFEVVRQRGN